jgi:hypothetical protein
VVGSQNANLTPDLSFGHNLCFRCLDGSCNLILYTCASITFQWYKELYEPMGFDPCNHLLKIQKFVGTLTPKMGVHLGVWGFIPSHSFTLPRALDVTPRLPSWFATLQALALVMNLRLGLRHYSYQKTLILQVHIYIWSWIIKNNY